jgi:hypothetical protein
MIQVVLEREVPTGTEQEAIRQLRPQICYVAALRPSGQPPYGLGAMLEPIHLPYGGVREHVKPLPPGLYLSLTAKSGTKILLDNFAFRDVFFFDSKIVYQGNGPVSLQNVHFINCTFEVGKESPWMQFSDAVMSSGPTNFGS